jgi:hypothetical protein
VYGGGAKPPPPGPHASPEEHERATGAEKILRRGGNVRRFLGEHGDPDG